MSRLLRDELRRRSVSSLLQIALFLEWPDRRAAVALYGMIERRFACSQDLGVQRTAAQAMVNCCLALGKLGRREAGIAICERLIERFGRSSDLEA